MSKFVLYRLALLIPIIMAAASGFFGGGGGSDTEVVAALNQNSIIDRGILLISMFGLSMPATGWGWC